MRSQFARKSENTYHHGDLRDALIKAALREAEQGGAEIPMMIGVFGLAGELRAHVVAKPTSLRLTGKAGRECNSI